MALKVLRDNLKHLKWVLWVVIAAMAALVFFGWGGFSDRADVTTQPAAWVGDEEITFGEFRQRYQALERQYREIFKDQYNADFAKQLGLYGQALNQVINRRVLLMEARDIGLMATDAEVRDTILAYGVFTDENGRFVGREEYLRILQGNRLVVDDFEASVRDDVLLTKLDQVLAATAFVSDADVEQAYRDQVEKARIRFVELRTTDEEIELDRSELETWLAEHPEDFEKPEQRVADYLLVDTNTLRQAVEIPEDDLLAWYDGHLDDYTREEQITARHILRKVGPEQSEDAVRQEVEAIRRRLEGGEDFAAVAREMSEDPGSGPSGGSLGAFGRGAMVPAFEAAAFNAQVGELVGPVKTPFGFHLIEVQAKSPGGTQPFDEVRASIRARLLTEEAAQMAETKALDLAGRITDTTTRDELDALAAEEGLEVKTTEPFGQNDPIPGVGATRSFNLAAFELEVDGYSEPLSIPRGWAILRLAEILEPRVPELDEVEDAVRQAMMQERRGELAVQRLAETVGDGKDLDQLAEELGVTVQESTEFGRDGTVGQLGRNREVIDQALALEPGQRGGPFASVNGAVYFEVTDRTSFEPTQFEAEKDQKREEEELARLDELRTALIAKRRRDLETRYDPSLQDQFDIVGES